MGWTTNKKTGIATNSETGATFQAAMPAYSPPAPQSTAEAKQGKDNSAWFLTNWTQNNGIWGNQPILKIAGQDYKFDTPQEYINKMQGLSGAGNFIKQFEELQPFFEKAASREKYTTQLSQIIQQATSAGSKVGGDTYLVKHPTKGTQAVTSSQLPDYLSAGYQFMNEYRKTTPYTENADFKIATNNNLTNNNMGQIKLYAKDDPSKTTTVEQSTWDKFKDTSYRLWTNVSAAPAQAPASTPAFTAAATKDTGWYDEVTGKSTPVGVGTPRPIATATGEYIPNIDALKEKQKELIAAGVPENEWDKYVSKPDAQGKLYFTQPATLTSPKGEKKIVGVGSAEASQLLSTGWTLGDKVGGGTIRSDTLPDVDEISVEEQAGVSGSLADQTAASVEADIKSTQDQINKNLEMLKAPEGDLSTDVQKLLDEAGLSAGELTGRGEAQLTEEAKRKIEEQQTVMANKNTELEKKLAEIKSLTASYQLANQQEEGRPQTLSRLQGAQAQNYKMYLAQKNALTSEAGYMQAELLGLQGKLDSAQSAANRAVDLEYADREADYNAKINQLNLLLPQLEKEEAQYAQAVQTTLQQQADALDEQKAERKQIQSVKLQAISAGITDPNILNQIGNSSSYDEALQILGTNIPEEVAGGGGGVAGGTGRGDDDETSEWDYARNILEANPNATDEELKTGLLENTELNVSEINSLIGTRPQKQAPEVYSDEWFKSKIDISKQQGYSIDEIVDFLIENYSEDELFKVAKEKGFAKWHTGKTSDIKRYVESLI